MPTGIVAGNTGHVSHHNTIHALLNPVDAPFGVASIDADTLASLPAAGQAGRQFLDTSSGLGLLVDDGVAWRLADQTMPNVQDPIYGATPGGIIEATTGLQAALTAIGMIGGGTVSALGTYLTDTLVIPSNVTLDLQWRGVLTMKPHSTTHNPVVRMGTAAAAVSKACIRRGKIIGNSAGQTFGGEQWSHGVQVWGSNDCVVEDMEITDCKGDGVTIGYDTGRNVGSNGNTVNRCELYGNTRQQFSLTWGNDNKITYNRISGNLDLEIDAGHGEIKNNTIHGNTGRIPPAAESTTPWLSDLGISSASVNTEKRYYSGNIFSDNHVAAISLWYNDGGEVTGNVIVGSTNSQTYLMSLYGADNVNVTGNTFVANTAVASALAVIIDTKASSNLEVSGNTVRNEAIPFHNFTSGYGAEPGATNQNFHGNTLTGTGPYRLNGSCTPSEETLYKVEDVAGTLTVTRVKGPPTGIVWTISSDNLRSTYTGHTAYLSETLAWGSASVGSGATDFDKLVVTRVGVTSSVHDHLVHTVPITAGAMTLTKFLFSSGTGTFLVRVLH